VARSSLAPHAVIVNQGLRYPRRNGTTTRYLSEPEVASAYRERLAGAQGQAARVKEIEREALGRLDPTGLPWVAVSLVPDIPGDLPITGEVFTTFQQQITSQPATVVPTDVRALRASVGRRRLLADGTRDDSPLAKWISFELHTDGSGVFAICVLDLIKDRPGQDAAGDEPRPQRLQDEGCAVPKLAPCSELAFPVAVRPLCKARSTTWRCCAAGGGP
jgi:hypothetical protein